MFDLETRHTFVTGNFGSGKTEVAVNLARALARDGQSITLADLDVVNPYFRSREATAELEALGVETVVPMAYFHADLPVVLPEVKGAMLREDRWFIGDVGGDDVGARLLGGFAPLFKDRPYSLFFVLNAHRPFTDTAAGAARIMGEIENASRMRINGLISNAHLMEHTDVDTVRRGIELARDVGDETGVPLKFATAPESLGGALEFRDLPVPVLLLERTMLPPWKQRKKLGSDNFKL